jgi:hypothetical protein
MSAQPEALRLADMLKTRGLDAGSTVRQDAAAELRRLHAGIEAERESRQAAQIENEALKARIARADVELQRAVIAEREGCAKLCDEQARRSLASADKAQAVQDQKIYNGAAQTAMWNAAAIRARGAA